MSVSENNNSIAKRCVKILAFGSACSQRPPLWRLALLLTALSLIILTSNHARAFETLSSTDGNARSAATTTLQMTTSTPLPTTTDSQCLHLLKLNHIGYSTSAMDQDRHSAGQAAGIGFVFGIRFALDSNPNDKSKKRSNSSRLDIWQPGVRHDPHANAVAEYNRCKSDAALKALNDDWRWSH